MRRGPFGRRIRHRRRRLHPGHGTLSARDARGRADFLSRLPDGRHRHALRTWASVAPLASLDLLESHFGVVRSCLVRDAVHNRLDTRVFPGAGGEIPVAEISPALAEKFLW